MRRCAFAQQGADVMGIDICAAVSPASEAPLTRNPTRWKAPIAEVERTASPPENPSEEEVKRELAKNSPMKLPWLQPQDIAPVAVFLASDEAHFVSGATYDGTAGDSANWTA